MNDPQPDSKETENARLGHLLRGGPVNPLTPLRYERRIARNRAIFWGCLAVLMIFLAINFLIKYLRH